MIPTEGQPIWKKHFQMLLPLSGVFYLLQVEEIMAPSISCSLKRGFNFVIIQELFIKILILVVIIVKMASQNLLSSFCSL